MGGVFPAYLWTLLLSYQELSYVLSLSPPACGKFVFGCKISVQTFIKEHFLIQLSLYIFFYLYRNSEGSCGEHNVNRNGLPH